MASFDYKKAYCDLYLPGKNPVILDVPTMNFVAVSGEGDPNTPDGDYSRAVGLLYAVSYTVKMSKLGERRMPGYFEYVVPPLEGLWHMSDGRAGIDYAHKENFCWRAMIRLPEFVSAGDFDWALEQVENKKGMDVSRAEFFTYNEGMCVQCMHHGPYDDEPATVAAIDEYARTGGYVIDISDARPHHEIYLNDPRRCAPERLRTVVRHPIAQPHDAHVHDRCDCPDCR